MPRWTIDSPRALDLPDVAALRVRLISGSVAILGGDGPPSIDVASVAGQPLLVTHEAGILTISYEDLQPGGMRGWLRPHRHSAELTITVPGGCPANVSVVNASAIVSGISANISTKSVSGDITLDGVTGSVNTKTVSGDLEARDLDGDLAFNSAAGGLTVAGGTVGQFAARTVSGQVTADVELRDGGGLKVATVSGDVAVRIPERTSARVDLRSASGRLRSSFDALSPQPGARPATARGTLGSGSASVSLTSVAGDVALLVRAEPAPPGARPASGPGVQENPMKKPTATGQGDQA